MAGEDDGAWTIVENKHQKKQRGSSKSAERKFKQIEFQNEDRKSMREKAPKGLKDNSTKDTSQSGTIVSNREESGVGSPKMRRGIIILNRPVPEAVRLDDPSLWPSLPSSGSRDSVDPKTPMSYSTVTKHTPSLKQPNRDPSKTTSKVSGSEDDGTREEDQAKSKKKKKKKKKSGGQEQPVERKTNQPVLFDIGSMLEAYSIGAGQQGVVRKPEVKVALNSAPHALHSSKRSATQSLAPNLLDSSAPVRRRGKEREDPKKKRPSAMRKVLIKEREERHRIREQGLEIPQNLDVTLDDNVTPRTEKNAVAIETQSRPKHLHNRQYREYCDQVAEPEIDNLVELLLRELGRFQDRVYMKEPQKLKTKRRYVCGLREVAKHLMLKKLKVVIIARNLDRITSTGGIDDVVFTLIETSREQEIPVVFALTRQHMGRIMKKKVPISAVGIFSCDGAERYYKPLLELVEEARQKYQILLSGQQMEDTPDRSAERQQQQQQQQQQTSRDSPQESISYQMCTDLLQSMRVHGKEEGNHDDSDEVGTPPDYEEDSPPFCDTPTDQATNRTQSKSNFVFNVNAPIFRPNFTYSPPKN